MTSAVEPLLVTVIVCAALVVAITWPAKVRLVLEREIPGDAGLTLSVAGLLVTVPAVLVTTTWKVDPLSPVVVAGVV